MKTFSLAIMALVCKTNAVKISQKYYGVLPDGRSFGEKEIPELGNSMA